MKLVLLVPLAAIVIYHDVRYRRIPNMLVLSALIAGLTINILFGGLHGLGNSLLGLGAAFIPMLMLHIFGAMGAGDVKLMGAVGSILGVALMPVTLILVIMVGGMLAVVQILICSNRRLSWPDTVPYGVAIMLGSLISAATNGISL